MDFSEALREVKSGSKIARKSWGDKGRWVATEPAQGKIVNHEVRAKLAHPLLLLNNANGTFSTWIPNAADLLAEDWEVIK